jgi:hypothetical protein
MSFYTSLDWVIKLRLFSYVLNLKIDIVLKALRDILISRFSLNEAPLGLFKYISDYLPYFEKKNILPSQESDATCICALTSIYDCHI